VFFVVVTFRCCSNIHIQNRCISLRQLWLALISLCNIQYFPIFTSQVCTVAFVHSNPRLAEKMRHRLHWSEHWVGVRQWQCEYRFSFMFSCMFLKTILLRPKVKKHVFYVFICKVMFLASMTRSLLLQICTERFLVVGRLLYVCRLVNKSSARRIKVERWVLRVSTEQSPSA